MRKTFVTLAIAAFLTATNYVPAQASNTLMKLIGPVFSVPVGTVAGLLRGGVAMGASTADSTVLGTHFLARTIEMPVGFAIGLTTGSVTGGVKGMTTGLIEGINDPLSLESASLDGDFIDYDPYTIIQ